MAAAAQYPDWMKNAGIALLIVLVLPACNKDSKVPSQTAPEETAAATQTAPEPQESPTPPGNAEQVLAFASEPIRIEGGFATPESVIHDVENDVYYVSNINGQPAEADGNGFISKVLPDGSISELKWIEKLDAPKGMAIIDGILWVSDINKVRKFDIKTGKSQGVIAIKGASFLNDLAHKDGIVYVADTGVDKEFKPAGTDAVYTIDKDGKVEAVIKEPALHGPNGLASGDALYMVTWGGNELHRLDEGQTQVLATLPKGQLDGLVFLSEDEVLISSWECGCVYAGPLKGPFVPVVENVPSPADIGWDAQRKQLLIPLFNEDTILIYSRAKAAQDN